MTRTHLLYAIVGLAIGASYSAIAAQDRPGIPTQARVWIENKFVSEAVPVKIIPDGQPMPVEVVNGRAALGVKLTSQSWEYRSVKMPANADPVSYLQQLGLEGWETSFQIPQGDGSITIVLKRPR